MTKPLTQTNSYTRLLPRLTLKMFRAVLPVAKRRFNNLTFKRERVNNSETFLSFFAVAPRGQLVPLIRFSLHLFRCLSWLYRREHVFVRFLVPRRQLHTKSSQFRFSQTLSHLPKSKRFTYLNVFHVSDDVGYWCTWSVARTHWLLQVLCRLSLCLFLFGLFVLEFLLLELFKLHRWCKYVDFAAFSLLRNLHRRLFEQVNGLATTFWKALDKQVNLRETKGAAFNSCHQASLISITWSACFYAFASVRCLFAWSIS